MPSTPPRSRRSSTDTTATPPSRYHLAPEPPETPETQGWAAQAPGRHSRASLDTNTDADGDGDGDGDGDLDLDELERELRMDMNDDEEDDDDDDADTERAALRPGSGSSWGSGTSFHEEAHMDVEDEEGPLTGRRRWIEGGQKGLFELIPPLILAHSLPLLPLLGMLPYNFLPGGVVLFLPALCVLTALSACAHVVIVYLAWYLKVDAFESVFYVVAGKRAWGLYVGRGAVVLSVVGVLVSWVETFHPLLEPLIETHLPKGFWQLRVVWTVGPALMILPVLMPARMKKNLRRSPIALALLLPVVVFIVIGRTVEIQKAQADAAAASNAELVPRLAKRAFGLAGSSSAGAGVTALTLFVSPHINTLSIHAQLDKAKRPGFAYPCLAASLILLLLSIPLALVPYYILPALPDPLPTATPTTPSGVFARLPADDAWVNVARVLMLAVSLGSCSMWLLRARDTILAAMGVDRGERDKAGKWVGLTIWVTVVVLGCVGGVVAEKLELMGVMATLAVSWFLPAIFFIITFHVRSPLAIVFPSRHPPTESQLGHHRAESTNDPSTDILLARKETQLQKRRSGRRLWQDLIVYLGIMPVGASTLMWTFGALLGLW